MHMFRTCVVIHKQFVKCGTFDEALAMFRAAVKEAHNPEGRQCPDKGRDDAAPATGSGKDPAPEGDNAINGKDAADIYDESNEAGFCMEWCFERKQMVRVTHVKFRVRNIILWRNRDVGEEQGQMGGRKFGWLGAKKPPADPKAPGARNLGLNGQQEAEKPHLELRSREANFWIWALLLRSTATWGWLCLCSAPAVVTKPQGPWR